MLSDAMNIKTWLIFMARKMFTHQKLNTNASKLKYLLVSSTDILIYDYCSFQRSAEYFTLLLAAGALKALFLFERCIPFTVRNRFLFTTYFVRHPPKLDAENTYIADSAFRVGNPTRVARYTSAAARALLCRIMVGERRRQIIADGITALISDLNQKNYYNLELYLKY